MITPVGIKYFSDLLTKFVKQTIVRDAALYNIGMTVVKRIHMVINDSDKKHFVSFDFRIERTMEDCPNKCEVPICAFDFEIKGNVVIYNTFNDYKVAKNMEHLDRSNKLHNFLMN